VLGFQATLAKANTEDLTVLRAVDVKQTLTTHVQSLARTVDVDWHDSYEETAEEVCELFFKCGVVVEACFRVSVCHGVAFDLCHEVLKIVADSWESPTLSLSEAAYLTTSVKSTSP